MDTITVPIITCRVEMHWKASIFVPVVLMLIVLHNIRIKYSIILSYFSMLKIEKKLHNIRCVFQGIYHEFE